MVGNDIVDLHISRQESNWQRKGWIQKIFSAKEQAAISLSTEPEKMVWLFWSMKEAAYKIFNRNTGKTFYAPDAFDCIITAIANGAATGKVFHESLTYHTKTFLNTDYIHTIARADGNVRNTQALLADNTVLQPLQLPPHLILLKDKLGLPYMQDLQQNKNIPASISHHGRYYALAYQEGH